MRTTVGNILDGVTQELRRHANIRITVRDGGMASVEVELRSGGGIPDLWTPPAIARFLRAQIICQPYSLTGSLPAGYRNSLSPSELIDGLVVYAALGFFTHRHSQLCVRCGDAVMGCRGNDCVIRAGRVQATKLLGRGAEHTYHKLVDLLLADDAVVTDYVRMFIRTSRRIAVTAGSPRTVTT
ncbi:MAG: hypothetical protein HQL38_04485 [Alphaproteobacteria bacterium]|nr:hypothetical protein [Alphaproteobacteria bacterium]